MSDEIGPELTGRQKSRPLRVAFLVEPGEYADLVLDGIFADCYLRWGGRFSLIVPCANGRIADDYWQWLEVFDPDIVYSYVELTKDEILEIHERLVPADYIFHRLDEAPRLDLAGFRPRTDFPALSSLSAVFRLGRHSPLANGPKIKIIDSWHTERPTRFLTDNFGTYHTSAATGIYPNDARTTAGLLTVVSDEYFQNRKYAVPNDLDRIASEKMAFAEFVAGHATSMSQLSALYATRLEIRDRRWSGKFNLVIGESFDDRLLFWNARLMIPTWLDNDICCFRLTFEQLKDQDMFSQLVAMINRRNHVNDGTGGQSQLQVRSASHSTEDLAEVLDMLRAAKVWSSFGPAEVILGGHVIPSPDSLRHARELAQVVDARFMGGQWHDFRWRSPFAHPPAIRPEHLNDAPSGQSFTLGLWAMDLRFEYERDKPNLSQENLWMLPKRWRMAGAFQAKYVIRRMEHNNLPPMHRTSKHGNLTLFVGVNRALESIAVPTIEQAIRHALCFSSLKSDASAADPPLVSSKVAWMRASNETPHLTGVLGMTGGLMSAKNLLLHPFLQNMFAGLGGAPNLADADVHATANSLVKRARRNPVFDLQLEDERIALAALIVKAAQSIKAPKMHLALDYLRNSWNEHRERYWAENPERRSGDEEELSKWDLREQDALNDRLAEMRARRMLFQGYPWICTACQHRNWTDFQALAPSLACDICRTKSELPLGIPWHFRPNEFLIESLRSRSVLSLIWVLSALCNRAQASFIYLGPTCFGYSHDTRNPDSEADLLALIDGESIVFEVKSAWRSLRAVHIEDFVRLAKRLRPDRAVLAVMEEGRKLNKELDKAANDLKENGIEFELLTPTNYSVQDDPMLTCY
ncbi:MULTISPECIES: hypothetical protein [Pseudomonas]|uniref:hypothetical protein n=1 Tax=Pseudomonas TaxID=286 RepID=UPI000CF74B49|nr:MULTISPECIES: hypothetical protein [Pseudomonas]AVJ35945.1 hypothetical protein CLM75_00890 [Pseudomonas lurida]PRA13554.1 hypothetical protein CQ002_23515 [Pseudomonas sp. MYb13]PRA16890.1 hypothetical protein CQ004_25355 [Pseudomonas lurida]PRA29891.1 hypothetical protein CQ005_23590 [Pseudomonas lurida]PRB96135.1 hypothetical protein CQ014_24010 [Pseudomonas lurida]